MASGDEAGSSTRPCNATLLRDAQELLAFVLAFEQAPQRRRRVFEAVLHVDPILELTLAQPAGEGADRLRSRGT